MIILFGIYLPIDFADVALLKKVFLFFVFDFCEAFDELLICDFLIDLFDI